MRAVKRVPELTPAERRRFLVTKGGPRAAGTRGMGGFG